MKITCKNSQSSITFTKRCCLPGIGSAIGVGNALLEDPSCEPNPSISKKLGILRTWKWNIELKSRRLVNVNMLKTPTKPEFLPH